MSGILLDTHIWFWFLTGSARLPRGIMKAIDEAAETSWLSPISIWELGMLVEKGRVSVQGAYRDWALRALQLMPLREAPLNRDVAMLSLELDLPHKDPADRFLAATALVYDLTLATVDERLVDTDWLPTLGTRSETT
ncbi:MAG: type II toxin-antitoxin system VapC family toxin [bacterium]